MVGEDVEVFAGGRGAGKRGEDGLGAHVSGRRGRFPGDVEAGAGELVALGLAHRVVHVGGVCPLVRVVAVLGLVLVVLAAGLRWIDIVSE